MNDTIDETEARTLIGRWMPGYEGGRVLAFLDQPAPGLDQERLTDVLFALPIWAPGATRAQAADLAAQIAAGYDQPCS